MTSMKETGGWAEDVTDEEIVDAIKLLAETEGIFTETAGGVTLGVAKKLVKLGRIKKDESVVVCVTGNGLKTQEAVQGHVGKAKIIHAKIDEFDHLMKK
jgi:threonine synthase